MANNDVVILQEFEDYIKGEEQRIQATFDFERRVGLLELARSMDYAFVYSQAIGELDEGLPGLIAYGLHKALNLLIDNSSNKPGAPLFSSKPDIQKWADSLLQYSGRIGYGEYILDLCRSGLATLQRADANTYDLVVTGIRLGAEKYDRENIDWLPTLISEMQKDDLKRLHDRRSYILAEMSRRVRPWRGEFVQYTTSPEIDAFYQLEGLVIAQRMIGSDSFPKDTRFGGIEFSLYCGGIVILVGWAKKHLDFCFELLKQRPKLNPRNILTIHQHYPLILEDLSAALEVDPDVTTQILQALTLRETNKGIHCRIPANMITPIYIQIGSDTLLRPLWGPLSNPFFFLLNELRASYPSDWDRAVNLREQAFRRELYQLFPLERFHKVEKSINLKVSGKVVTDIDALILDRETGTAAIFQLKWQDFVGNSIVKRESQRKNLLITCNQWIEKVSEWLNTATPIQLAQAFGISVDEASAIQRFRLVVIGRNAAHFSGSDQPNPRAIWVQWYEFVRLLADHLSAQLGLDDPLETLYQAAQQRSQSPHIRQTSIEEMKIGNKLIRVVITSLTS